MRGLRDTARIGGGLLAALLLAACGGGSATTAGTTAAPSPSESLSVSVAPSESATPTEAATPELKTGTERQADGTLLVTDTDAGFQVSIPRGYTKINNRDQLKKVLKAGSKALTGKASSLAATAFADNVKVFALNKLTGQTVNVLTVPSGGTLSEDLPSQAGAIKALMKQQFKATQITTKAIKVDGDTALRANCVLRVNGVKAYMTQVYAVSGEDMFVVTVGGPVASEKLVTGVVKSLHFI